jgi:hypothetical protein
MKTDEAAVYMTLVEAAREIDESPDVLRQAMKRNEIRAVKENPANKRSRWLVALEDVKRLYGSEPDDDEATLSDVGVDDRAATDLPTSLTSDEPATADDQEKAAGQEVAVTRVSHVTIDGQTASEPPSTVEPHEREVRPTDPVAAPLVGMPESVPSIDAYETGPTVVESAENDPPIALPIPTRGEDLVERFTNAVDRLNDNLPKAPFDYQALLDKYVAAVERAADADVEVATLKRRMDDLNDQVATTTDRLDEAHAENRRLLVELDSTRSDLAANVKSRSGIQDKPLWKRRNR